MVMSMTSTSTVVTITGSVATALPQPSTDQTLVKAFLTGSGAARDIYTCPANTIFYFMGAQLRAIAADYISINDNAGIVIFQTHNVAGSIMVISSAVPIAKLTAGQKLKAYGNGDTSIWGYEVAA